MQTILKIAVVGFVAVFGLQTESRADEFRVESKIYNSENGPPVSESLTLFHEGRAYDLLSAPQEITIFDIANNRIVMLDPVRKVRTEVETDGLTTFVEQLRIRASRHTNPSIKFTAEPKFVETAEEDGRLIFSSPSMTYRIQGKRATSPAAAQAYREFADWAARLTTRVREGAQPPFPRLAVNAALERRGILPDEVELSLADPNRPKIKPTTLRSVHKFETQLYPADQKRIAEADKFATDFEFIQIDKFIGPPRQARR
jgi:hypothetical protein